jgi:hypothetical protein
MSEEEPLNKYLLNLYFQAGLKISFFVSDVTAGQNAAGKITSLRWTTHPDEEANRQVACDVEMLIAMSVSAPLV